MYAHVHSHADKCVVQMQALACMCASVPKLPPLSLSAPEALARLRARDHVSMRVHAMLFLRPDASL